MIKLSNYNNNDFGTRRFNLDDLSEMDGNKDFSLNPEAKKYYNGESYTKQNTINSQYYQNQPQNTENYEEEVHEKPTRKSAWIAFGIVFVIGALIFMFVVLKLTYRNDVFYKSDKEDIVLEKQEPKVVEDDPYEEELPEIEVAETEDEEYELSDRENTYEDNIGSYVFSESTDELGECAYSVNIDSISPTGEIMFSVALTTSESSDKYETGLINAQLNDKKGEFNWEDNHGNSGTGEISLKENAVSIMLIESETSGNNTLSLATDNPITIPKVN